MDAQNAVEPASTKPAASPKRTGIDSDQPKPPAVIKSPANLKPESPSRDTRPGAPASNAPDEDGAAEGNSDAETIVLPGKDGHSPSKVRKIIKHEDKSDGEDISSTPPARKQHSNGKQDRDVDRAHRAERPDKTVSVAGNNGPNDGPGPLGAKKKKAPEKSKNKDGSSGLSSAPASPPQRRRRSSNAQSKSDSETAQVESPRNSSTVKDKAKSLDKAESEDEAESRKVRRQRTSGSGLDASRKQHHPAKAHTESHPSTRTRSISPQPRAHRRSVSTQLPGQSTNGLSHKKKRVPAPLQSTDYHSDESSASGSPHPRSSKLRSLTTPATADSNISPAKMAPHKKHLDAHGQTFLARACAKGEYEIAKTRLQERPEDINVADYAGNTPLQISALNGFDDIVKLLVAAGCNLDCVNNDKDTPLLDAVENGHLEVVKILLAAGVNPRKTNAYGQEPMDRVGDEENAEEIKRALEDAKQRMGERRRTSEDHQFDHTDARSSHGPDSPRQSPGAAGSIHAASGRRAGTVRSNKTSNHLLYMPMDDKTLRQAAARGDEETVTRILQVRDKFDDPESMIAAARGGHEIVMQLLLALGRANPDPTPLAGNDFSTPMLAAIGQENIKVIRLLLDQNSFDPTRRYKGETYYELARRRRGPNWIEEEQMLKNAYDGFRKSHKDGSKNKSPNRREQERESRRIRAESKDETSKSHKRKASSPAREPKKLGPGKVLATQPEDQASPKRGPGRPKKEDRAKRAESDLAAASSEGEAIKPRRKLVSGRELKGERDKNRRASMTPRDEGEKAEKTQKTEKLSISGESPGKRPRSSATPPIPGRRLDVEGKERPSTPRESGSAAGSGLRIGSRSRDKAETPGDQSRRESGKSISSENSIHVKSEELDADASDARASLHKEKDEEEKKKKQQAEADAQTREVKRKEEQERKRKEEEDREKEKERLRVEEEAKRLAEEAEAKRREEEEQKRKEEDQREQREQEEHKQREEEERRRQEEEEKKRLEEERERKEKEAKRKREEEERKKREDEERLRKEQLEREAAEEAQRKREEEEQEMERRRAVREAERVAREAEQRRIRLEQERIRLAKLPPLLRWLDGSVNPKVPEVAEKFSSTQGVRYDCIRPEASGTPDGREQWLLNTQVALLLGEKDLKLSRYTAWTRIPVSPLAKRIIWRLESDRYALTTPSLYELGKQLPDYYGNEDPGRMSYRIIERLRGEAWEKFAAMDMFFVKASDFMYIIPAIHHLHNIRLTMAYRELPETDAQLGKWVPQKWKSDPDANRFYGFAPSSKHFVNGELVSEDQPGLAAVSISPFPEKRVPRRGLVAVEMDDPAYSKLCKEQGLEDLASEGESPLLPNGVHSSPLSASSRVMAASVNGLGPSTLVGAATTNGIGSGSNRDNHPISPSSEPGPAQARPLVDGAQRMVNGGTD
ncbi:hypothetical protein B0T26DRAFT_739637 [Lasiosphaeria miniovina]|uniref:Protein HOS4 n=1 Tax=Lasiosphaeria miniovina TaxID=1954250 RepID=A0AA40AUT8_9PEZI|nr:uncharacterized protein B0T26DRAFT_739637 [Lasiosphaeria miniovina]KAK0722382.1 hypothetical protein B0T26DRAFT_739637 [Lasiosphaeria miniovina]